MARKERRVTIEDVAREAGVSPMTVSRVVNNTGRISDRTRRHVQDVISRMDYRPSRAARTLVTRQTKMIAIVVPDITNPYFAEILQGAEDVAWAHGYGVLLSNTNERPTREEAVLSQIEETTADGLIVCASRLADDVLLPLIAKRRAVVLINREGQDRFASVVRSRYGFGYRAVRAARYLVGLGRRRIGYLLLQRGGVRSNLGMFVQAMNDLAAETNPDWYRTSLPTWESGYEAARGLLADHPELDAVVGGNDLVALGTMRAAIELGRRIPDDLALIGGDDILMAREVTPALTTFSVPKFEMGAAATRLLLDQLGGDARYQEYLYDEEMIVRASTG